jgi:hypothetical protein
VERKRVVPGEVVADRVVRSRYMLDAQEIAVGELVE